MAGPPFGPPSNLEYVCTLDSLIHVNIVMVSAVLALGAILTDTKKEGVVF